MASFDIVLRTSGSLHPDGEPSEFVSEYTGVVTCEDEEAGAVTNVGRVAAMRVHAALAQTQASPLPADPMNEVRVGPKMSTAANTIEYPLDSSQICGIIAVAHPRSAVASEVLFTVGMPQVASCTPGRPKEQVSATIPTTEMMAAPQCARSGVGAGAFCE